MEKEVKKRERLSELSFWLDDYTDLFSDFDPRPYSERSLSYDFVSELKRATRDKLGKIKFSLLLPKTERVHSAERVIRNRLYDHFKKQYNRQKAKARKTLKQGIMFCMFGVITMVVTTLVYFYFQEESLLTSFLVILLEPAGWFLFWEGLNLAIFESRRTKSDLIFYRKMSDCKLYFSSY